MKFNIALATLFLAAVGASGANAQDVSLNLSGAGTTTGTDSSGNTVQIYKLGSLPGTAQFDGTLVNNTANTYTFDGASISPALPVGVTEMDQVNSNLNTYTLTPHETLPISDLFSLQVPTGASTFEGYFSLTDSADVVTSGLTGLPVGTVQPTDNFEVQVTAVPEPAMVSLLAGSLLSGGLLLRRRK